MTAAYGVSCSDLTAAKDACVSKLPLEVRADCVIPADTGESFDIVAKRMITNACGE